MVRFDSRAPHGARGLKQDRVRHVWPRSKSRPTRGAWIETQITISETELNEVAPHTGRVD